MRFSNAARQSRQLTRWYGLVGSTTRASGSSEPQYKSPCMGRCTRSVSQLGTFTASSGIGEPQGLSAAVELGLGEVLAMEPLPLDAPSDEIVGALYAQDGAVDWRVV